VLESDCACLDAVNVANLGQAPIVACQIGQYAWTA